MKRWEVRLTGLTISCVGGKVEGTERGGRRSKQLLNDLKEKEHTGNLKRKH
jgi:hypothetical protein